MKTKEQIEQLANEYSVKLNNADDAIEFGFVEGYNQCQEDMYEFGKLILDTFNSEGKTHSGKDRLARIKFDAWFKTLNK